MRRPHSHQPHTTHGLAHHRSILLLHMGLIIFDPRAPTRKGQLVLFTIRDHVLIEELRAAIGVNAQEGKREERASLRKRLQHGGSTLLQQRDALFSSR